MSGDRFLSSVTSLQHSSLSTPVLLFRPAMISAATRSSSHVKFLKTAHYKQDMFSHAWKIKPLYLHFPEGCLLQKFEANCGPCLFILAENINCLQSLLEHLFHISTSELLSFFCSYPSLSHSSTKDNE